MFKKSLGLLLCVAMVSASLAGCGNSASKADKGAAPEQRQQKPKQKSLKQQRKRRRIRT